MLSRTLRLRGTPRSLQSLIRPYATNPSGQNPVDDTQGSTSSTEHRTSERITINATQTPQKQSSSISKTNEVPMDNSGMQDGAVVEAADVAQERRVMQAPNRATTWSRSQQPRELAMSGPRFEQTIMEFQPRPYAAIDLIHKQPVRWTKERLVSCDGGGGPLGHPRIFINVDKPQICHCTYCGLPFANTKHRAHLESLPTTSYPLEPQGKAAEVPPSDPQKVTNEAYAQR